tara:strand:- start:988 stop:1848 length:861 start_codon:yes stop_codon:yes gene_type:complete
MDKIIVQDAINKFKNIIFNTIKTAQFINTNGEVKKYSNGLLAKTALIRSSIPIMYLHESVKKILNKSLSDDTALKWKPYPRMGERSPELKIVGRIKPKDQDIVFLNKQKKNEIIRYEPLVGFEDLIGYQATKTSIILGIRSQMSSVEKNFDTLMERAIAETLNLRLRIKQIIMGEVYMLPLYELDDTEMKKNKIKFKKKIINIEKYIRTFNSFTLRSNLNSDQFKYDSSMLILVDFMTTPPKIIYNQSDLLSYAKSKEIIDDFQNVMPENFDKRLIKQYKKIHKIN